MSAIYRAYLVRRGESPPNVTGNPSYSFSFSGFSVALTPYVGIVL